MPFRRISDSINQELNRAIIKLRKSDNETTVEALTAAELESKLMSKSKFWLEIGKLASVFIFGVSGKMALSAASDYWTKAQAAAATTPPGPKPDLPILVCVVAFAFLVLACRFPNYPTARIPWIETVNGSSKSEQGLLYCAL